MESVRVLRCLGTPCRWSAWYILNAEPFGNTNKVRITSSTDEWYSQAVFEAFDFLKAIYFAQVESPAYILDALHMGHL